MGLHSVLVHSSGNKDITGLCFISKGKSPHEALCVRYVFRSFNLKICRPLLMLLSLT